MCPQGPQGYQRMCHHPLNMLMEVWWANIEHKLQKDKKKNCQKTGPPRVTGSKAAKLVLGWILRNRKQLRQW